MTNAPTSEHGFHRPFQQGNSTSAVTLMGLKLQSNVAALMTSALVGLPLTILGLWATANALGGPIGPYDEGILLSGANFVLHRALPIRQCGA